MSNKEKNVIEDFGNEWDKFNQGILLNKINEEIFNKYFSIFPWHLVNNQSIGMDVGSGSGRWAFFVAKKVKKLYLLEPSLKAISVSKTNLIDFKNLDYLNKNVLDFEMEDNSLDFCYSLGVLHHIEDIDTALKNINKKLRAGAPFLIYLYYSFENKPFWFKLIWKLSDLLRRIISLLPFKLKSFVCDLIAYLVYFPISRFSFILKKIGIKITNIPLSFYHDQDIYILRNDALDRFGTKIENRYSKEQITKLLIKNNFNNIHFSNNEPYWCAICYKVND